MNPQINAECTNIFEGQILCLGEIGQDCNETYVIASGDSCGAIGVPLDVLLANNPNVNSACSNIYPGEVGDAVFFCQIGELIREQVLCVAATEVYA